MLNKNKKLPPLTPSRTESVISNAPKHFSDLRSIISLIEKARTSTSHEINKIINQLQDIYKSDCHILSMISTSNSQKSDELSKYEKDYQSLEQKYTKFKNTTLIIDELKKTNLQERIERLQSSISEIKEKSQSLGSLPKMKELNANSSEVVDLLQLTNYNYQLLENYIHNLSKREIIIDQSTADTNKVNEKYGSVTNLVDLFKQQEVDNLNLKNLEKKYFHDKLLRRYPLAKLSNSFTKFLASSLQYCFSQELSLLHTLGIEYNDKDGNDACAFLKEENDPPDNVINKLNDEIEQLEHQIKDFSQKTPPELDFEKLYSADSKLKSVNHECLSIAQKIKKVINEKKIYSNKVYEFQNKLDNLLKDQSMLLLYEKRNNQSCKSIYQCTSALGLSLILNINRNEICNAVYRWLLHQSNDKIIDENDKVEKLEEEDPHFLTRPTSTIAPPICSLLNKNFIRNNVQKPNERRKKIDLLSDGVICEFFSGLDIVSEIGSQLNFTDGNRLNALNFFKSNLNELYNPISQSIDNMKKIMFSNLDVITKLDHQMLVKNYSTKQIQVSLINRKDNISQTDEIKNEKKRK